MFRNIKKPYRIGHSTTTKEFNIRLSNTAEAGDILNTAVFRIKNDKNTIVNFRCRIYGDYHHANEVGYAEYIISYKIAAGYVEIKCIRNNMPSVLPFGFNINPINNNIVELEIIYIGGNPKNAQHFCITFMNNTSISREISIDDILFKETKHTDIHSNNIRLTPYYGDSFFLQQPNMKGKFVSKSIPEAGGFTSEFIVAGYLPNLIYKYAIRIPKRFPVWYVISSISDYTVYNNAIVYSHNISYVYNSKVYKDNPLKIIPLYHMSANVSKVSNDMAEYPNLYISNPPTIVYSTKELVLKYDGEDDVNWYYHAENLTHPGNMDSDNFIQIVGCKNWYNNDMKASMMIDPVVLTEKKLQNKYNLYKLYDSKHIFYSSFLYMERGVVKYVKNVA